MTEDSPITDAQAATHSPPPPDPRIATPLSGLLESNRVVLVGILSLVTVVAFEAFAVASVMPVVAAELGAVRNYSLAFSLFLTATLLGTVVGGGWGDATGPRWPAIAGLAGFCGGLVICGLAPSLGIFLLGRAISGLGGGVLIVALYLVIALAFAEQERPRVFGLLSAAWVVPSLIGPVAAGWLAENLTWRLAFLLVAPIGIAVLVVLWRPLSQLPTPGAGPGQGRPARLNQTRRLAAGVVLSLGALVGQTAAQRISGGEDAGPGQGTPITVAAWVGTAVGVALVAGSLPRLLPAGSLRLAHGLPAVIGLRGMFTAAFFAAQAYLPLALISERGYTPTEAGLVLTASSLAWAAGAWAQGRILADAARWAITAGALCIAVMLVACAGVFLADAPTWLIAAAWALGGAGMGLSQPGLGVAMLALAPPSAHGRASAALQLMDSLGAVVAIAGTGAVFAWLHSDSASNDALFAGIWGGLAVIAFAAAAGAARQLPREPNHLASTA